MRKKNNKKKRKKKKQIRRFDSTLGYPGEGPPQSNPQEKYNIVSLNIGGAGSQITQEKYRKLITWMVETKVRRYIMYYYKRRSLLLIIELAI